MSKSLKMSQIKPVSSWKRGSLFGKPYVFCLYGSQITSFGPYSEKTYGSIRGMTKCNFSDLPCVSAESVRSLFNLA